MKPRRISEVMAELARIKAEHGDVPVLQPGPYGGIRFTDAVDVEWTYDDATPRSSVIDLYDRAEVERFADPGDYVPVAVLRPYY